MATQRRTGDLLETVEKLSNDVRKLKAKLRSHEHAGGHILRLESSHTGSTGLFGNTSFTDLDNLTQPGGFTPSGYPAVSVTLETGSAVVVIISAHIFEPVGDEQGYLGYRVSGATSVGANNGRALRHFGWNENTNLSMTYLDYRTGLNPGTNTFTLQGKCVVTNINEGIQMYRPSIMVIPLN